MRISDPKILTALPQLDVELRRGASLAELTSLGIGGTTDLLQIKNHDSIPELLNLLDSHGIPHRFLGGGSNLLVEDGDLSRVAVRGRAAGRVRQITTLHERDRPGPPGG